MPDTDRSFIVRAIIGIYAVAVLTCIGYLIFHLSDVTAAVEILKLVVLPVVTLVLGYYFATKAGS